jgi:sorting nexin-14
MSNFVLVLQEPADNIVKLRTTPPLFQAYEYAYSLLENSLCPLFHESDDVSNVMQKCHNVLAL